MKVAIDRAKYVRKLEEKFQEKLNKLNNLMDGLTLMMLNGFNIDLCDWHLQWQEYTYECEVKDLPSIHKAIGKLKHNRNYPAGDGRKRMIIVELESVLYPGIKIRYNKKLPKDAKCKIVTKKQTYRTMVCGI